METNKMSSIKKKNEKKKNERIDLIKWMSFHCKLSVLITLFAKADVQIKKFSYTEDC